MGGPVEGDFVGAQTPGLDDGPGSATMADAGPAPTSPAGSGRGQAGEPPRLDDAWLDSVLAGREGEPRPEAVPAP
jgi:hypothetical protein